MENFKNFEIQKYKAYRSAKKSSAKLQVASVQIPSSHLEKHSIFSNTERVRLFGSYVQAIWLRTRRSLNKTLPYFIRDLIKPVNCMIVFQIDINRSKDINKTERIHMRNKMKCPKIFFKTITSKEVFALSIKLRADTIENAESQ